MQNFNHKFDIQEVEVTVGSQTIKLQTGLIAKQSDGAVVATMGETMVLATAVSTKEQNRAFPILLRLPSIIKKELTPRAKSPAVFSNAKAAPARKKRCPPALLTAPSALFSPKASLAKPT